MTSILPNLGISGFQKTAEECCKCKLRLDANVCKHEGKTYCPGCYGHLTGNWNPFNK